ncbi:MAG: hypothetical protein ISS64_07450 [Desulfobacterales bacterium]|nr:hypothetical protein [Desulfobacterales bacterium]
MTHQYAKTVRKKLQKLAGLAHERELSGVQEDDLGEFFITLGRGQSIDR